MHIVSMPGGKTPGLCRQAGGPFEDSDAYGQTYLTTVVPLILSSHRLFSRGYGHEVR